MSVRRVSVGRYHDGKAKPNWGGRATSLALAGLVHEHPTAELAEPVNGTFIITPFEDQQPAAPAAEPPKPLLDRFRRRPEPAPAPAPEHPSLFGRADEVAEQIVSAPRTPPQKELVRILSACDEFWMNGEGDFILRSQRSTLARTMLIMAMARRLGKPVRLVNSILSESPDTPGQVPEQVRDAVEVALSGCASIIYRDPQSLELHSELFPGVPATWAPDALFGWAGSAEPVRFSREHLFTPAAEGLDAGTQSFLASGRPYITVSGSSVLGRISPETKHRAHDFVRSVEQQGLGVVMVATDSRDDWMRNLAGSPSTHFVEARVPLAVGMSVLAGSAAFVSGRYHPSILAADLGVPTVLMASNSHKTRSLQRLLGRDPVEFGFFSHEEELPALLEATVAAAATGADGRAAIRATAVEQADAVRRAIGAL
jgi:polysaccharide pyruvyl transferase WcaK-like protein